MQIIYDDRRWQYQTLVLPKHKRTLIFNNNPKLVKIPKSIVMVYYDKEKKCINVGFIFDFDLNYFINFGNSTCTNGKTFDNIYDYINWYWNSRFEGTCRNHWKIKNSSSDYLKLSLYYLTKYYQPQKNPKCINF